MRGILLLLLLLGEAANSPLAVMRHTRRRRALPAHVAAADIWLGWDFVGGFDLFGLPTRAVVLVVGCMEVDDRVRDRECPLFARSRRRQRLSRGLAVEEGVGLLGRQRPEKATSRCQTPTHANTSLDLHSPSLTTTKPSSAFTLKHP